MANLDKHIWEGWTARQFVEELEPILELVQSGRSYMKKLETKAQLKEWCKDNQPYYKKYIPEVVNHLAQQYNLK